MTSSDLQTTPVHDLLHGYAELEHAPHGLLPHRVPAWARAQVADPQLDLAERQSAGVRLVLRTDATVVEVDLHRTRPGYVGMPLRADGVVDLVVDGRLVAQQTTSGGDVALLDPATGRTVVEEGPPVTVRFDGLAAGPKTVEVWLPWNETTQVGDLRTDAAVVAVAPGEHRTWVHHGSSISHGSNAASPTGTWPVLAALAGGVDLVNLGLGGSALLDPCVARVVRDRPADLVSLKVGINVVLADLLRRRAFGPAVHGWLDTVRDGHPDVPLLVVTPVACPGFESTPGPGTVRLEDGRMVFTATGDPADVPAGRLTLEVVRAELARVVAQRQADDPHLHLLDGLTLYGPDDAVRDPLPDDLHPSPATHASMGERFAAAVFGPGGAFAVAGPE